MQPPEGSSSALPSRQRTIVLVVALVCAATRFLAMARSHWGWDEALFNLAMRDYDVTQHHPHPPGFPVFIALAKIVRLVVDSDFRALQGVNLLAGMLLFPALFLFAREIRLRFTTSVIAAALLTFFPNVWYFGGTALSDVPSITMAVFGAALLLRGRRSSNAYFVGTAVLALAIGIRPQNLLIGLVPGILATLARWRASKRDVLFAATIGTAISLCAFAAAAVASGDPDAYLRAVQEHGDYISRVDSFRAHNRPPLWRLIDRFFFTQYQSPVLSAIASIFAIVSVVGAIRNRDRAIALNVLTFAPVAIMTWLMLDRFSVNRFSIGYAPMFAILAADGISRTARRISDARAEAVLGSIVVTVFALWTLPALTAVRTTKTPTARAVEAVRAHVDPKRHDLYVGFSMTPHVDLLAPDVAYFRVKEERSLPLSAAGRQPLILAEFDHVKPTGLIFQREQGRLFQITRRNYYDVMLQPIRELPLFGAGWHGPERDERSEWRWMEKESLLELPAVNGNAKLGLVLDVPPELVEDKPLVTVKLNGVVLDRIIVKYPPVVREYDVVAAPQGAKNVLELTTTRGIVPHRRAGDPRLLGLKLRDLVWGPRKKAR